jgi:hypothetical protein
VLVTPSSVLIEFQVPTILSPALYVNKLHPENKFKAKKKKISKFHLKIIFFPLDF